MNVMKKIFCSALAAGGVSLAAADELPPARHQPLPVAEFYKVFQQVNAEDVEGASFFPGVFLGTAGTEEHYNSLTLGWGAFGSLWSRPVAIVYIRQNRYSYLFFEAEPIFTLSWYPEKYTKEVYKIFGGKSGRDVDKEELSGFTPVATPDGGVTYLQADRVIVCRRALRAVVPQEAVPEDLHARLNSDGYCHVQYTGLVLSIWERKAAEEQRPTP